MGHVLGAEECNKPGHGSDLSKWHHLAVEMVDGACRSDRKRTEIYNIFQVMQ